jgi:CRISPR-associated endoribonuclease Cas6
MPNAIVIPLQRTNDAPLPAAGGETAHAAFFTLLKEANPELAARLHANPDRKPFTLSAVIEDRRGRPRAGQSAMLRVTFLDDSLFPHFAGALLGGGLQAGICVGQAQFMVTGLLATAGTHPQAGHAAYEDLAAQAKGVETLAIRFLSPTLFRSQGQDLLWPSPRHVWQSWIRAWNTHTSPTAPLRGGGGSHSDGLLDEARLVELAETRIAVQRYRLETYHVSLSEGGMSGFVGTCVYGLKTLPEADRRLFALLADFAFYCGTGRKTTMGMGQTARE